MICQVCKKKIPLDRPRLRSCPGACQKESKRRQDRRMKRANRHIEKICRDSKKEKTLREKMSYVEEVFGNRYNLTTYEGFKNEIMYR
jgi:hypothetical protein